VFFLKESTRNIRTWWISGFCSFVIQGFVRRALMEVLNDIDSEASEGRCLGAREYLQLAVRLFVASTRTYDPLIRQLPQDYISEGADDGGLHFMEVKIVQLAVKQIDWKASGIEGSGDYLKRLFEDDGRNLLSNAKAPAVSNYPHLTSEDDENEPSNFSKSITGLWKAGPPEPEFDPSVKSAEKHQTIDLTDLVSMRQSKYLTEKSRFASLMLFRSSPGKPASL
jgi:hypothetical protein